MANSLHVVPHGARKNRYWAVNLNSRLLAYCLAKKQAVTVARAVAKDLKCSVFIHLTTGRISEERSYGNETKRPG